MDVLFEILFGLIMVFNAGKSFQKTQFLNKFGKVADGTIDRKNDRKYSFLTLYGNKVAIRFLTDTKLSIYSEINDVDTQYKEGEKVKIIYNPENPKEFMIEDDMNLVASIIFILIGLAIFSYGIYQYL